jgi:hypothetical protein
VVAGPAVAMTESALDLALASLYAGMMGYMSTMAMPGMQLKQLLTSSNNNIFPYMIILLILMNQKKDFTYTVVY